TLASSLDAIAGIGPMKKKNILKKFGSVKRLKAAPAEEIYATPGLSAKDVQRILKWLERL
ncbi:MAG: hypothetical protein ACD_16C00199G0006, partial [uncultured bacterium]